MSGELLILFLYVSDNCKLSEHFVDEIKSMQIINVIDVKDDTYSQKILSKGKFIIRYNNITKEYPVNHFIFDKLKELIDSVNIRLKDKII